MPLSLNWQPFAATTQITPTELYSRVRVDSAKSTASTRVGSGAVASYGQNTGPQKASMTILLNTLESGLERLNRLNGTDNEIQPLLTAVKSTINELGDIYGEPVADMVIGLLQQSIPKSGAINELALSGAFDKLITKITNDESLLEKNKALSLKVTGKEVQDGQWVGEGLISLWNAGMNAVRDINGNFSNGEGEYWGGDEGLVLRNQAETGIAYALAEFFGSNMEEVGEDTILKRTKVFIHNNKGQQDTQVMRQSVQWVESRDPDVVPETFVEGDYQNVVSAIQSAALKPEIEKAVKYLLEEIGDEQAANMLQDSGAHFIDTALQVLDRVKTNKGEQVARQVMRFFDDTFTEKINRTTIYDEKIYKMYGDSFSFTGFSDKVVQEVFDDDQDKAPAATSPFYANWGYKDESGHMQAAVYIGLGSDNFFGKGPGARGDELLKQLEQEMQDVANALTETLGETLETDGGVKISSENLNMVDDAYPKANGPKAGKNSFVSAYLNNEQKQPAAMLSRSV